jgi:RNA polymerase sigma-70 factor, ECF subfamily
MGGGCDSARRIAMMSEQTLTPVLSDPDQPLVRRACEGHYDAFEALVERHQGRIYTLALRIVRDGADAQEVVQETFLSLIEHLKDFAGQSAFRTWLGRIATNHALKVLRRRRSRPAGPIDLEDADDRPLSHPQFIAPWRDDPGQIAQRREMRQLLDEAMEELDDKYRLVFLLRDVQGLSTEQTAEALGLSVANVKVRLLRARLMLRERLTQQLGDARRQVQPDHEHRGRQT